LPFLGVLSVPSTPPRETAAPLALPSRRAHVRLMLDRRQFLSAAAAGAAITLIGVRSAYHDPDARDLAHPELLAALGRETVREIGQAYRALVPEESDATTLEAALRAERRAARESTDDPVRADFAAGRVIVVSSWVLSRIEARQCALFSLRSA
jgi:hypothetical protein